FSAVLMAGFAASANAADVPITMPKSYEDCVDAIKVNASDAFERALYWRDHQGGPPAEHCAALALIDLNQPGEAARRLDVLAHEAALGPASNRAAVLDQAGNAWLLAGENENAERTFSAGLKLAPRSVELWVDRSRAYAELKNWPAAEDDLNHALAMAPNRT